MRVITDASIPIYSWAEELDDQALRQAIDVANHPRAFHHIALAPDAHGGYGMPIGGIAALENAISPYMVGSDIACSMLAAKIEGITPEDIEDMGIRKEVHDAVKREVPTGFKHNSNWNVEPEWEEARKLFLIHDVSDEIFTEFEVADQLGTLGSNNHFMEFQYDQNGSLWIMIHCGSRNLGAKTCGKYYKLAVERCEKEKIKVAVKHLAFFDMDSELGQEYYKRMLFCMDFSHINKIVILDRIIKALTSVIGKVGEPDLDNTHLIHHNFAREEVHYGEKVIVHRKGTTPAEKGCIGIIPGDMGSHSYIVRGLGNPLSFESCSHGAGRAMSRTAARDVINLPQVKVRMEGIYFDACKEIIDEAPGAYKDIGVVMDAQTDGEQPLVEIVHTLSPLISIKDTSPGIGKKRKLKNKDRTCPNGHLFGEEFDKFNDCKPANCTNSDRSSCRHRSKVVLKGKREAVEEFR